MKLYDLIIICSLKGTQRNSVHDKWLTFNLNINRNYVSQTTYSRSMSHTCSTCWCIVQLVLVQQQVLHNSSQLSVGCNICMLRLTMVEIFTPWQSENGLTQCFFSPRVTIARYLVYHDCPNYFCIRQK